ncbi:hypothetical protein MSMAW_1886 [Methanosarcina mazei WWM610]|uniref:Uncharacterized protein n=1 Tax=Methanosarcina mazei WWM610 TaxID=1434117 RepID=A0A0E3PWG4_METMZ|nr:hypothetical protein MSMAW_1886 [Methanosarcina mazei WWM610]
MLKTDTLDTWYFCFHYLTLLTFTGFILTALGFMRISLNFVGFTFIGFTFIGFIRLICFLATTISPHP